MCVYMCAHRGSLRHVYVSGLVGWKTPNPQWWSPLVVGIVTASSLEGTQLFNGHLSHHCYVFVRPKYIVHILKYMNLLWLWISQETPFSVFTLLSWCVKMFSQTHYHYSWIQETCTKESVPCKVCKTKLFNLWLTKVFSRFFLCLPTS